MVYRVYVEKKKETADEAAALLSDARTLLGIDALEDVRVINRYDAEGITGDLFEYAVRTVFSEPSLDNVYDKPDTSGGYVFAVEYLPGQFDQRSDSAAQCIQMISKGERPLIKAAKVYVLYGALCRPDIEAIKKYVINPVDSREAALDMPDTLKTEYDIPTEVETLKGFTLLDRDGLEDFVKKYDLAMDIDDLCFCRDHFRSEMRDPTITEIRMTDTYWSDHCRHTTFNTVIDDVTFEDGLLRGAYEEYLETRRELCSDRPVCLMDIATIAAKYLKKKGKLNKSDESAEVNACTVRTEVEADGKKEPWLILFKNETHNHPTEIEPFGGAATCIGGAIRDPLSGRAYPYAAMRVTGAADPLRPISETIRGKLPQRKIVTRAAEGYSSYGNQIGLATGIADEIYHPGYVAKRMEIGAVIAAVPEKNVRREPPLPGDVVILLGGGTGRDGIGGATGASKAHDSHSVETCGAEVQKGNAPEERKLLRLFRNAKAARLIKRCNDFGAGGVSVAVGELADGLKINLNAVPKKYEGLDGTELAISESQERMAAVISYRDLEMFLKLAKEENLNAVPIAEVTEEPRLVMSWNGRNIVDLSREFLNSNGAEKHISIIAEAPRPEEEKISGGFKENHIKIAGDLNICSKRGLSERFDSTVGAGTVLMPFGGKYQLSPIQAMVHKISLKSGHTDDCTFMSWGYDPFLTEQSPYHGGYCAVVESVAKLIATGASFEDVYLTFQEYFERPGRDPKRWGKPLAALLGAFMAQKNLGIAAIGGKDSMSGSFEDLHVPATLVSFAVTTGKTEEVLSPEFKKAGDICIYLEPEYDKSGLPAAESLLKVFDGVTKLIREGAALSCYTPCMGGIAAAVMKMAFGNGLGFKYNDGLTVKDIFRRRCGTFILEVTRPVEGARVLGEVTDDGGISLRGERIALSSLLKVYEGKLESVYTCNIPDMKGEFMNFSFEATKRPAPAVRSAKPAVLIPVFPGTNCEYDSAKAVTDAGASAEIFVINNLCADAIAESVESFARKVRQAQMIFIPGGFSGGDEPDGAGKFITAFFRSEAVKESVDEFLERRGGLMCGICNGFQALIKLGLVPYGKITDMAPGFPTLTFNAIGRHQSKIVRTRVASNKSPWLALTRPGEIYNVPISHGEGRFLADDVLIRRLANNGQIATQYVDLDGNASGDVRYNPNGSAYAVEGITSPDGRVFGKMGHCERVGDGLYKNVSGNYNIRMFEAAVNYFK